MKKEKVEKLYDLIRNALHYADFNSSEFLEFREGYTKEDIDEAKILFKPEAQDRPLEPGVDHLITENSGICWFTAGAVSVKVINKNDAMDQCVMIETYPLSCECMNEPLSYSLVTYEEAKEAKEHFEDRTEDPGAYE